MVDAANCACEFVSGQVAYNKKDSKKNWKLFSDHMETVGILKLNAPSDEEIDQFVNQKAPEPVELPENTLLIPEPAVSAVDVDKVEEPKTDEVQAEEPKVEEVQAEEPKVEEPKVEEVQVEEPKVQEVQAEGPQAEEAQAE